MIFWGQFCKPKIKLPVKLKNINKEKRKKKIEHKLNTSLMHTIGILIALRSSSVICLRAVISTWKEKEKKKKNRFYIEY